MVLLFLSGSYFFHMSPTKFLRAVPLSPLRQQLRVHSMRSCTALGLWRMQTVSGQNWLYERNGMVLQLFFGFLQQYVNINHQKVSVIYSVFFFFFGIVPGTRHVKLFFRQSFNYSSPSHEPPGPAAVLAAPTKSVGAGSEEQRASVTIITHILKLTIATASRHGWGTNPKRTELTAYSDHIIT